MTPFMRAQWFHGHNIPQSKANPLFSQRMSEDNRQTPVSFGSRFPVFVGLRNVLPVCLVIWGLVAWWLM